MDTAVSASGPAKASSASWSRSQSAKASSRSACWMGDNTLRSRHGHAGLPHGIDGGKLGVAEPGCAERARRLLGVFHAGRQQRGASLDGGSGVVQLVCEARGELAERHHLLVVQRARREQAAAIQHLVDEDGRDLVARMDHGAEVLAADGDNLGWFLHDRVVWRTHQARVGEHAGDVAGPPFDDLVSARAAIREDCHVTGQHEEEARSPVPLSRSTPLPVAAGGGCRARPTTQAPRGERRRRSCGRQADPRDQLRSSRWLADIAHILSEPISEPFRATVGDPSFRVRMRPALNELLSSPGSPTVSYEAHFPEQPVFLNAIHQRVRPATELCVCPVTSSVLDTDGGASSWLPPGLPG